MGEQPVQVLAEPEEEQGLRVEQAVRTHLARRAARSHRTQTLLRIAAALLLLAIAAYLLVQTVRNHPPHLRPPPSPAPQPLPDSPAPTPDPGIRAEEQSQSQSEESQQLPGGLPPVQLTLPNRAVDAYLRRRRKIYEQLAVHFRKLEADQLGAATRANLTQSQLVQAISLSAAAPLLPTAARNLTSLLEQELDYYSRRYDLSRPELAMCVVVPSFRNSVRFRYFLNLWSILQQNYSNYHVVVVDDASGDGTAEKIGQEIAAHQLEGRVKLVANRERKGHMANIYSAVHEHCREDELLLVIDGDDELIGRQVFKLVNAVYYRDRPLAMYTNHIQAKKDTAIEVGISLPYPD